MSDKVGIAIVGLGRIARTHISGIHLNPGTTRLVAVVDVDEPLAKSTAATYKTRFYTSVEAALTDPEIQAMVICLPHHLHKPVSLQVMETGRHVLTEKPMSTNLEDAQAMVEKAEQKEVVLMTGQCFRFISASLEAKLRMKKEIGEPFNLVYVEGCDFDKNKAPHWWRDTKKTGGMAFTMLGSHTVDLTLWIYE
ncbi:MAG: Gfo/Idh/MocA family oxidoreductase, partial [Dehalococcoidales bacterium]